MYPILGPLVPLFWISGEGFKTRVGPTLFTCFCRGKCNDKNKKSVLLSPIPF